MAANRPFGSLEYRPIQIAPPQPQYQFSASVQQNQSSHSPHPTPQPAYPQPSEPGASNGLALPSYSNNPFDWVINSIATFMQTQHLEIIAKLDGLTNQQNALSTKLDTLQKTANGHQQNITSINSSLREISGDVSKLGLDMASRDAMLATRLSALDDAIDPDGRVLGAGAGAGEGLQTPPSSETRPGEAGVHQPEPASEPVDAEPRLEQPGINGISDRPVSPPPSNYTSSTLSSLDPSRVASPVADDEPASPPKAMNRDLQKVKEHDAGVPVSPRRSSRPPKKRKQTEASIKLPSTSKRRKSTPSETTKRAPAKDTINLKKPSKFEWSAIPVREGKISEDQFIVCDTCDVWYHWGCINISPSDPIVRDEETPWACPPCAFEAEHHSATKARTRASHRYTRCRPDCTNAEESDDKFAIESLVGRFPNYGDPTAGEMIYLIKWEDYGLSRATWTPENEIGDSTALLIQKFEAAAREEGHDLSDLQALVLLNEATEAGWGFNQAPPQ